MRLLKCCRSILTDRVVQLQTNPASTSKIPRFRRRRCTFYERFAILPIAEADGHVPCENALDCEILNVSTTNIFVLLSTIFVIIITKIDKRQQVDKNSIYPDNFNVENVSIP